MRERAAHRASTALTNGALSQCKGVHVQCRFDESRHILDHKLSCDIELRPLIRSPGLLDFPRQTEKASLSLTGDGRKSRSTYHTKKNGLDQCW